MLNTYSWKTSNDSCRVQSLKDPITGPINAKKCDLYFFRMRKAEIEAFIKQHTFEYESLIRKREKQKVSFPREGYLRTAACNIQRKLDFDQDQVVMQQWLNLVTYIVEVTLNNLRLRRVYSCSNFALGYWQWRKIDSCQDLALYAVAHSRVRHWRNFVHGVH